MSTIHFEDPHIRGRATLRFGEHEVTVPAFLPDEAETVAAAVRQAAAAYYRTDPDPLAVIGAAFATWADPDNTLRREALPVLAGITGFSPEAIGRFGLWPLGKLRPTLSALETQHAGLLELVESGNYRSFSPWGDGWIRAFGAPDVRNEPMPNLLLHILAGNVVGPTWLSLLFGLAGRSGQILKLPADDPVSFLFLLQSLEALDPHLRNTIACGYFPGGGDVQRRVLGTGDVVFALGSDATMEALKADIDHGRPGMRLVAHGLKIGFQVIGREYAVEEAAELVAWGASACDGNACFSPANVYLERGGLLAPSEFADAVADHMARIAEDIPPKRTLRAAERITEYRQRQFQRRILGQRVLVRKSPGTDWTVVLDEEDPALGPTCQERTIVVKPVADLDEVPRYVRPFGANLQTVGLAVPTERLLPLADQLGAVGATNLKMLGTEYIVGLDEPHDGIFDTLRLTRSDALRWTHIAFRDTDQALKSALHENRTVSATIVPQPGDEIVGRR